jgi:hypothetical protein
LNSAFDQSAIHQELSLFFSVSCYALPLMPVPTGGTSVVQAEGRRVTWAEMVRDVLVTAMDRGQLPVLAGFAVLGGVAWRLPPEELTKFAYDILDRFTSGSLLGWGLFILAAFGWWWHVRKLLMMHVTEVGRIGNEKSAAQDLAAGERLKGSKLRKPTKA